MSIEKARGSTGDERPNGRSRTRLQAGHRTPASYRLYSPLVLLSCYVLTEYVRRYNHLGHPSINREALLSHPANGRSRLRAVDHAVAVTHGDRMVILDTIGERYYSLNDSGAVVWECLCGGTSFDDLCITLQRRFDVTAERAHQDIRLLLEQLDSASLLVHE